MEEVGPPTELDDGPRAGVWSMKFYPFNSEIVDVRKNPAVYAIARRYLTRLFAVCRYALSPPVIASPAIYCVDFIPGKGIDQHHVEIDLLKQGDATGRVATVFWRHLQHAMAGREVVGQTDYVAL
jgi:hypothetical protein